MIRIDPNTLYGRDDLIDMFKPLGINWDRFQPRLNPRKISRFAIWGADLIEALNNAPRMPEQEEPAPPVADQPKARRGRPARSGIPSLMDIVESELKRGKR